MSKLVIQDGRRNVSLDNVELAKGALQVAGGALDSTVERLKGFGVPGSLSHGRLKW